MFLYFIIFLLFICLIGFLNFKQTLQFSFSNRHTTKSFLLSFCHDILINLKNKLLSSFVAAIIFFLLFFIVLFFSLSLFGFYYQLISFLIGCFVMFLITFISFYFFKIYFNSINLQCQGFLLDAVLFILKQSHLSCYVFNFIFLISLFSTIFLFGLLAIIGYALGICFACFLLSCFSRFFYSSTFIPLSSLNLNSVMGDKVNESNPLSILHICSQFLYKFIAFSSDMLSSFILAFVSSVLLSFMHSLLPDQYVMFLLVPFGIIIISFIAYIFTFLINFKISDHLRINNYFLKFLLFFITISIILFSFFLLILNILFSGSWIIFLKFIGVYSLGLLFSLFVFTLNNKFASTKSTNIVSLTKESEHGRHASFLKSHLLSFSANTWLFIFMITFGFLSYLTLELYGVSIAILSFSTIYIICLSLSFYTVFSRTNFLFTDKDQQSSILFLHSHKINLSADQSISLGSSFSSVSSSLSAISLFISLILYADKFNSYIKIDKFFIFGCFIAIISYNLFFKHITSSLLSLIYQVTNQAKNQINEIPFLKENIAKPDVLSILNKIFLKSMQFIKLPSVMLFLLPFLLFFIFNEQVIIGFIIVLILFNTLNSYYWSIMSESLHSSLSLFKQGYFGGSTSSNSQYLFVNYANTQIYETLFSGLSNMFTKATIIVAMIIIFLFN